MFKKMIDQAIQKILGLHQTPYCSELDRFLMELRKNPRVKAGVGAEFSTREQEQLKHKRLTELREEPKASRPAIKIWEDF